MIHPALAPSHIAVVTGGASGIGLATVAALNLKVCIADRDDERLHEAADEVAAVASGGGTDVLAAATDVSDRASVRRLHERGRLGRTGLQALALSARLPKAVPE